LDNLKENIMEQITQILSLFVNKTNQIEVVYEVDGTDAEGYRTKRREGRVWSPTDDIASDTLSGAHPDVKKLAATYWTPDVVESYSANLIAQANAERDKQQAAITEAAAKKLEAEAAAAKEIEDAKVREVAANEAKALAEAAEAASKAAQELAKVAAADLEAENARVAAALAAKQAAEDAAKAKAEFDAAVAAAVQAQVIAQNSIAKDATPVEVVA
jgi:hypothetical protein